MLDVNSLPAVGYVPTKKVWAPVFLFPPKPLAIAIGDPELGHLDENVQKRNSQRKGIPQDPSAWRLRNGDDDYQESGTESLGNGEFPRNGGPEIKEIEKRNAQPSMCLFWTFYWYIPWVLYEPNESSTLYACYKCSSREHPQHKSIMPKMECYWYCKSRARGEIDGSTLRHWCTWLPAWTETQHYSWNLLCLHDPPPIWNCEVLWC